MKRHTLLIGYFFGLLMILMSLIPVHAHNSSNITLLFGNEVISPSQYSQTQAVQYSEFKSMNIRLVKLENSIESIYWESNITTLENVSIALDSGTYKIYTQIEGDNTVLEYNNDSEGYLITPQSQVVIPMVYPPYTEGFILDAPCNDGIQNGEEEGIDCGGSCPNQDCCANGYMDSNLGEQAVDCGGMCDSCKKDDFNCYDGIQNGLEEGIDCGIVACGVACNDLKIYDDYLSITKTGEGVTITAKIINPFDSAIDVDIFEEFKGKTINSLSYSISKGTEEVTATWAVGDGHTIVVVLDPKNKIEEADENNNMITRVFSSTKPIIKSIEPTYKGYFIPGIRLINPITIVVEDLDDDVDSIIASYAGQETSDSDGSDGWIVDINLGYLNKTNNRVKIYAIDKAGHKSATKEIAFQMLQIPVWLPNIDMLSFSDGSYLQGSEKFYFDKQSMKFVLDTGNIPEKPIKWYAQIPETIPYLGGDKMFELAFSVSAYYKLIGEGHLRGDVHSRSKLIDSDDGSLDLGIDGGMGGTVNDEFKLIEADGSLSIDAKIKLPTPYTIPNIPFVGSAGIYIIINPHGKVIAVFDISEEDGKFQIKDITGEIGLGIGASATVRANLWICNAKAELYILGDGTLVIKYPPMRIDQVRASIEIGGIAQCGPLSKDFLVRYVHVEPNNKKTTGLHTLSIPKATLKETEWSISDYSKNPYYRSLENNKIGIMKITTADLNVLFKDRYPDSSPTYIDDVVVWSHVRNITNISRSHVFDLMYSKYNTAWSPAQYITHNNATEIDPVLIKTDKYHLVYSSNTKPISDNSTIDEWLSDLELYEMTFDGTKWSSAHQITNNTLPDARSDLASDGNSIMLVWMKDIDNNSSTVNDIELYYSINESGSWSPEEAITSDTHFDNDPTLSFFDGKYVLAWSKDTDGNETTVHDREIYFAEYDGSWSIQRRLTDDGVQDTLPTMDGNMLVWVKDKEVVSYVNLTNSTSNETYLKQYNFTLKEFYYFEQDSSIQSTGIFQAGIESPQFRTKENKNILVWRGFLDKGRIYYSIYDNSVWSKDQLLLNTTLDEANPVIDIYDDNATVVWLGHDFIIEDVMINNSEFNFSYVNASVPKDDDLYYRSFSIKPDLAVETISLDNHSAKINDTITIFYNIANIGNRYVQDVKVDLYVDGELKKSENISSLNINENSTMNYSFVVSSLIHNVTVRIVPKDEQNLQNNELSRNFTFSGPPDLHVGYHDIILLNDKFDANDKVPVLVNIHNIGGISLDNISLNFYDGDPEHNGVMFYSHIIDRIAKSQTVGVPINVTLNGTKVKLFVMVDPENQIQESNENNNVAYGLIKPRPDYSFLRDSIRFYYNNSDFNNSTILSLIIQNNGNRCNDPVNLRIYKEQRNSNLIYDKNLTYHNSLTIIIDTIDAIENDTLYFVIDEDNIIDELDESNNVESLDVIISNASDLLISSCNIVNSSIELILENNGGIAYNLYLDIMTDQRTIITKYIPYLAQNEKYQLAFDAINGSTVAYIDRNNLIPEVNDDNNMFYCIDSPDNNAPILEHIDNITATERDLVIFTINATDPDGDVLNYSINDTRFNQSFNLFYWQTDVNDVGDYSILVTVSDGTIEISQIVYILITPYVCTENWNCTEWNDCINQTQTRICADFNNCGTEYNKPPEVQWCDYCAPNWTCSSYAECLPDDIQYCNGTLDLNGCYGQTNLSADMYYGNLSEFESQTCDYCAPDWIVNDTWSICAGNIQFKNYYDANGCYAQTNLASDLEGKSVDLNRSCELVPPQVTINEPKEMNYTSMYLTLNVSTDETANCAYVLNGAAGAVLFTDSKNGAKAVTAEMGANMINVSCVDSYENINNTEYVLFNVIKATYESNVDIINTKPSIVNASMVDTLLEISTSGNFTNTHINITETLDNPTNASFGVTEIGKYIQIEAGADLLNNLTSALIKIFYTDEEIEGLDENSLAVYWYNESSLSWIKLDETMDWVYGTGVNATANYVWANVSHFSTYGVGGQKQDGESCSSASECAGGYCVHGICRSSSTHCGDSYCDSGETCSSCEVDCGSCYTPSSGSGSSGIVPPKEEENVSDAAEDEVVEIEEVKEEEPLKETEDEILPEEMHEEEEINITEEKEAEIVAPSTPTGGVLRYLKNPIIAGLVIVIVLVVCLAGRKPKKSRK